jgi:hypothetical protein
MEGELGGEGNGFLMGVKTGGWKLAVIDFASEHYSRLGLYSTLYTAHSKKYKII